MNYHLEIEFDEGRRKKLTGEFGKIYDDLSTAEYDMVQVAADYAGDSYGCVYVVDEKGKILSSNSWS